MSEPTWQRPSVYTDERSDSALLRRVLERMEDIDQRTLPAPGMLRDWSEIEDFAARVAESAMCPDRYRGKPGDCAVCIQMGKELGLTPMMALNSIAVINGIGAVYGDAVPGLCHRSRLVTSVREWFSGTWGEDDFTAHCEVYRKANPHPFTGEFSIGDAIRARLWSPDARITKHRRDGSGSWQADNDAAWHKYPKDMLMWRARKAYRFAFPDVLRGLHMVEELDARQERELPDTIDRQPPAPRDALNRIEERYRDGPMTTTDARGEEAEAEDRRAAPDPPAETTTTGDPGPAEDDPASAESTVMTHDNSMSLRQWMTELRLKIGLAKTIDDIRALEQARGAKENMDLIRTQKPAIADQLEDELDSKASWISDQMRTTPRG